MDQNDHEIWLLKNNPGELISLYQELISMIVGKYRRQGYVAGRESDDLVQDINHKLLERVDRIQKQYNGQSQLRTYFSVIIRNICREEFRKNPKVEEPQPPDYHRLEKAETPVDNYLIKQEYQRFEKVLKLFFEEKARLLIMLRFMMSLKISSKLLRDLYPDTIVENIDAIISKFNDSENKTKKEKFEKLSELLNIVEGNITSPDSLRKWYISRTIECLDRMNGSPPRSGYDLESISILIEKYESLKK